jgi:hypothetical protein
MVKLTRAVAGSVGAWFTGAVDAIGELVTAEVAWLGATAAVAGSAGAWFTGTADAIGELVTAEVAWLAATSNGALGVMIKLVTAEVTWLTAKATGASILETATDSSIDADNNRPRAPVASTRRSTTHGTCLI